MPFLNPIMLAGLGGAAVPVVIHLIHRRRAPEHPFPAIELLMRSRKRVSAYWRLRHLLVMIARVLFVAIVAMALSRPFARLGAGADLGEGPSAVLILIDDTLSMQYRPGGKSLFEQARDHADGVLAGLRGFDRARVDTFSGRSVGTPEFSARFDALRKNVGELRPGYGREAAGDAVLRAFSALEAEEIEDKLLIVLSDLTRSSWREDDLSLLAGAEARVSLVDLGAGGDIANRLIESVRVDAAPGDVLVEVTVVGAGRDAGEQSGCVLAMEDGARAQATVDLVGGVGEAPARGVARLAAGVTGRRWFAGRVSIPEDRLAADNVHYVCGRAGGQVSVLLVDGDPRESLHRSESFYLELALRTAADDGRLSLRTISHHELPKAELSGYDCIVAANVPAETLWGGTALDGFLRRGGGLWVLLGDRVDAAGYRRAPARLLPARPVSIRRAEPPGALRIEDSPHPVFAVFDAAWLRRFGDARFRSYWLLEPEPQSRIVARFADGLPAMVEAPAGRGRVMVLASPLDRDWNDLCIRPVFAPLVHEAARYLAGAANEDAVGALNVGEPLALNVRERVKALHVLPPGESAQWQQARTDGEEGRRRLTYRGSGEPGIYRVALRPDRESTVAVFAVNVEPESSDLRPLAREQVRQRLADKLAASVAGGNWGGTTPLWPALLWMALAALVCESVLARR